MTRLAFRERKTWLARLERSDRAHGWQPKIQQSKYRSATLHVSLTFDLYYRKFLPSRPRSWDHGMAALLCFAAVCLLLLLRLPLARSAKQSRNQSLLLAFCAASLSVLQCTSTLPSNTITRSLYLMLCRRGDARAALQHPSLLERGPSLYVVVSRSAASLFFTVSIDKSVFK